MHGNKFHDIHIFIYGKGYLNQYRIGSFVFKNSMYILLDVSSINVSDYCFHSVVLILRFENACFPFSTRDGASVESTGFESSCTSNLSSSL